MDVLVVVLLLVVVVVVVVFEVLLVVLAVVVVAVVLFLLVVVVDMLLHVIVVVIFLVLAFATCTCPTLRANCFYVSICNVCVFLSRLYMDFVHYGRLYTMRAYAKTH